MTKKNKHKVITPKAFKAMDAEEKILEISGGWEVPDGKSEDEVLNQLLQQIDEEKQIKQWSLKPVLKWGVAAAIAAVLIISLQPLLKNTEVVQTAMGEHTSIDLPDGSLARLNADSYLSWEPKSFNSKRSLRLKGEGFFDVEKGNPFVVKTKFGDVQVLGTQLNIYARDKEFWVSCITGKVKVTAGHSQEILLPGDKVSLVEGFLQRGHKQQIKSTISWQEGLFHFEETQLVSIFAEFERQFNIKIEYKGNSQRRASIDFSNEDLIQALDVLTIPMELTYEVRDKRIIIRDR